MVRKLRRGLFRAVQHVGVWSWLPAAVRVHPWHWGTVVKRRVQVGREEAEARGGRVVVEGVRALSRERGLIHSVNIRKPLAIHMAG